MAIGAGGAPRMSSDWIQKMKENDERAESQESARLQKVVEDNMVVASGENEFFSHLIAAFESDAARMSEIGLFAHVTKQGSPDRYASCHIGVELRGLTRISPTPPSTTTPAARSSAASRPKAARADSP